MYQIKSSGISLLAESQLYLCEITRVTGDLLPKVSSENRIHS